MPRKTYTVTSGTGETRITYGAGTLNIVSPGNREFHVQPEPDGKLLISIDQTGVRLNEHEVRLLRELLG